MKHTKEFVQAVTTMMQDHSRAAKIPWNKDVQKVAEHIAEACDNSYQAVRAFCDYLYFKQLERSI